MPEQEGPQRGTWQKLEMFGSKELAYAITMHDYELFMAINQVFQIKSLLFTHFIYFSMNYFIKYLVDINMVKSQQI